MKPIVVLETGGKNDDFYLVKIKLFETRETAMAYCYENNDTDTKYWTRCEIIEEGATYEPTREENYTFP